MSPLSDRVALASWDLSASVWAMQDNRLDEWQCTYRLEGHTAYVMGVAFAPGEGRYLASTSADHTVKLWDVPHYPQRPRSNAAVVRTWELPDLIEGCAFSPDGQTLACACFNQTCYLEFVS